MNMGKPFLGWSGSVLLFPSFDILDSLVDKAWVVLETVSNKSMHFETAPIFGKIFIIHSKIFIPFFRHFIRVVALEYHRQFIPVGGVIRRFPVPAHCPATLDTGRGKRQTP